MPAGSVGLPAGLDRIGGWVHSASELDALLRLVSHLLQVLLQARWQVGGWYGWVSGGQAIARDMSACQALWRQLPVPPPLLSGRALQHSPPPERPPGPAAPAAIPLTGRQANLIMGGGPHRQQMVSAPAAERVWLGCLDWGGSGKRVAGGVEAGGREPRAWHTPLCWTLSAPTHPPTHLPLD